VGLNNYKKDLKSITRKVMDSLVLSTAGEPLSPTTLTPLEQSNWQWEDADLNENLREGPPLKRLRRTPWGHLDRPFSQRSRWYTRCWNRNLSSRLVAAEDNVALCLSRRLHGRPVEASLSNTPTPQDGHQPLLYWRRWCPFSLCFAPTRGAAGLGWRTLNRPIWSHLIHQDTFTNT
jgi:hypothetical protein